MKVFLFDDGEAMETALVNAEGRAEGDSAFCLPKELYKDCRDVDELFGLALYGRDYWSSIDSPDEEVAGPTLSRLAQGADTDKVLFIVNIALKVSGTGHLQSQSGVELLKHIRLTPELGHIRAARVALVSFQSASALLQQHPGNVMALSQGVSLLQLPACVALLMDWNALKALAQTGGSENQQELIPFVRGDYQYDAAHEHSNWWGIRQLIATANVLFPGNLPLPDGVRMQLLSLSNKKADTLFGSRRVSTQGARPALPKCPAGAFRLICIDDESDWSASIRQLLGRFSNGRVRVEAPMLPSDMDLSEQWVRDNVLASTPHAVVTDLRLRGRAEANESVSKCSGMRLVRTIRELSPGTPVILVTASNKAWTFEEAMNEGVDGYWMKEGIGEHMPPDGSVENTVKLLRMISTVLEPDYQLLRQYHIAIKEIRSVVVHWWQSVEWNDAGTHGKVTTSVAPQWIFERLEGIGLGFREYLRLFVMRYGYSGHVGVATDISGSSLLGGLLIEAAKCVELVHEMHEVDSGRGLAKVVQQRGDNWAVRIADNRTKAAHAHGNATPLDIADVRDSLRFLTTWLLVEPGKRGGARLREHATYRRHYG